MIFGAHRILPCGFIMIYLATLLLIALYFVSRFFFYINTTAKIIFKRTHLLASPFFPYRTFLAPLYLFLKLLVHIFDGPSVSSSQHPSDGYTERCPLPAFTARRLHSLLFWAIWLEKEEQTIILIFIFGNLVIVSFFLHFYWLLCSLNN